MCQSLNQQLQSLKQDLLWVIFARGVPQLAALANQASYVFWLWHQAYRNCLQGRRPMDWGLGVSTFGAPIISRPGGGSALESQQALREVAEKC